ncbi:hypothetical protein [Nonomuraea soli]|uniref:Uncharacterized protein n=1 Tax=Nonomuraea soli TaxID=1032476 RepID=A0A7W0CV48_9ACTN|nr:hypothetical protein [Nonomuraea soli]MBA2897931.1 hypothetical protein [Nonomuraea soli]
MIAGIYAGDVQVFRFYRDGMVLDALVRPAPGAADGEAIAQWLVPEAATPGRGIYVARYAVRDGVLRFTTRSHLRDEVVEVEARVGRDQLTLTRRDGGRRTNGLRFERIHSGGSSGPR